MPKEDRKAATIDPDALSIGEALRSLRERYKLSQPRVVDVHEDQISAQYLSHIETGKVIGILKSTTQRKVLDAISRAAKLNPPLTLDDLTAARGEPSDHTAETVRATRLAASLRPATTERQAIFPTSEGDVIFTFPAEMGPDGFRELEAYFSVFVKANTPNN